MQLYEFVTPSPADWPSPPNWNRPMRFSNRPVSSLLRHGLTALALALAAPLAMASTSITASAAQSHSDIVDTAVAAGQFTTLAAALQAAGSPAPPAFPALAGFFLPVVGLALPATAQTKPRQPRDSCAGHSRRRRMCTGERVSGTKKIAGTGTCRRLCLLPGSLPPTAGCPQKAYSLNRGLTEPFHSPWKRASFCAAALWPLAAM